MLPEPLLKWKSWPFVERPWTSIILIVFLILLSLLLYRITVIGWQQPFYYFLGMILVFGNLLPILLLLNMNFMRIRFKYDISLLKLADRTQILVVFMRINMELCYLLLKCQDG